MYSSIILYLTSEKHVKRKTKNQKQHIAKTQNVHTTKKNKTNTPQKRQTPHHQPPTLPMPMLQNILHVNQRHTPIQKTTVYYLVGNLV